MAFHSPKMLYTLYSRCFVWTHSINFLLSRCRTIEWNEQLPKISHRNWSTPSLTRFSTRSTHDRRVIFTVLIFDCTDIGSDEWTGNTRTRTSGWWRWCYDLPQQRSGRRSISFGVLWWMKSNKNLKCYTLRVSDAPILTVGRGDDGKDTGRISNWRMRNDPRNCLG